MGQGQEQGETTLTLFYMWSLGQESMLNILEVTNKAAKLLNKVFLSAYLDKIHSESLGGILIHLKDTGIFGLLEVSQNMAVFGGQTHDPRALACAPLIPPLSPSFLFFTLSCTGGPDLLSVGTLLVCSRSVPTPLK